MVNALVAAGDLTRFVPSIESKTMNPYESPINFDRRKQVSSHWLRMEFLLLALWGTLPIGLFLGHYLPSALGNFHAAGKIYPDFLYKAFHSLCYSLRGYLRFLHRLRKRT